MHPALADFTMGLEVEEYSPETALTYEMWCGLWDRRCVVAVLNVIEAYSVQVSLLGNFGNREIRRCTLVGVQRMIPCSQRVFTPKSEGPLGVFYDIHRAVRNAQIKRSYDATPQVDLDKCPYLIRNPSFCSGRQAILQEIG